jgi:hypothetical protein
MDAATAMGAATIGRVTAITVGLAAAQRGVYIAVISENPDPFGRAAVTNACSPVPVDVSSAGHVERAFLIHQSTLDEPYAAGSDPPPEGIGVCTENLIPLRRRANRLSSLGDQAPVLHSGRLGLAVQIEGAARG